MPGSSPLQAVPYLLGSDAPSQIDDVTQDMAEAIEKKLVQVYASSADRDSKLTAPTNGMLVFLSDLGALEVRAGGLWVRLWPQPTITSGSAVPSNATGKDGDVFFLV